MKTIKKLLTLLILVLFTFSLTACNSVGLKFDGNYWFNDATSFSSSFTEVLEYEISIVNKTHSQGEIKQEGCELIIDKENSYFKTTLVSIPGTNSSYRYFTEFKLTGKFVILDQEKEFVDTFKTLSEFTSDFKMLFSQKEYDSELTNYSYNYTVTYDDENANCSLVEYPDDEQLKNEQQFVIKNVFEEGYIDNDVILLLGRGFNVETGFSQTFKSVDVLSKKLHSMAYTASHLNETLDVKQLKPYALNGSLVTSSDSYIPCNHVNVSIQDTYSGSAIECYYAGDHKRDRHRLVEFFTLFDLSYGTSSFKLGYLDYTLKNVTLNEA